MAHFVSVVIPCNPSLQGLTFIAFNISQDNLPSPRTESAGQVLGGGVVPNLDYLWNNQLILGLSEFTILVHFTGFLQWPGVAGLNQTVTFYDSSDDGFYLTINDVNVIDNWTPQGSQLYNGEGSLTLIGGEVYTIDIWYYQGCCPAALYLFWSMGPAQSTVIVPGSVFAQDAMYFENCASLPGM